MEPEKKYHLVKWEKICKHKRKGGLGIKNLRKMNISLPSRWKLEKEEGLWQKLINYKYLWKDNIHNVKHKLNDSSMWSDLLKIKDFYLLGRDIRVKSGNNTRF